MLPKQLALPAFPRPRRWQQLRDTRAMGNSDSEQHGPVQACPRAYARPKNVQTMGDRRDVGLEIAMFQNKLPPKRRYLR